MLLNVFSNVDVLRLPPSVRAWACVNGAPRAAYVLRLLLCFLFQNSTVDDG